MPSDPRETPPSDTTSRPSTHSPVVVGIGASAGGLQALRELFRGGPTSSGMAFVVIQHLDPTHRSALTELLARDASIPVREVRRKTRLEPNQIYVIPPNRFLAIEGESLVLEEAVAQMGVRRAVDHFFSSLAARFGEQAVAVILSGTGSDGVMGAREIKQVGGLVVAQDPHEATQGGMPQSVIAAGLADLTLPAGKILERLDSYAAHLRTEETWGALAEGEQERNHLDDLVELLRTRFDLDFRRYRKSSLIRRVERRMGMLQLHQLFEYLQIVRGNEIEGRALCRDLLIGVTEFFRDPEAWECLDEEVLKVIFEDSAETVRVWTPGCATGEEAYTIAILLHEHAHREKTPRRFQVFATDISENALKIARRGVYPKSIKDNLSAERLARYFEAVDEGYRVSRPLRESVVFAQQNVLTHPPFSRLDLVICRNLLIYLEKTAQQRLLSVFEFALQEDRFLFLGSSESIRGGRLFFHPVSRKWRIFRRSSRRPIPVTKRPRDESSTPYPFSSDPESFLPTNRMNLSERVSRQLLSESEAAVAVVNHDNRIALLNGPAERYFQLELGELSPNLPDLLTICREGLRIRLREMMEETRKTRSTLQREARVKFEGRFQPTAITCRPLRTRFKDEDLLLFTFASKPEAPLPAIPAKPSAERSSEDLSVKELQLELSTAREQLNSTIEELEAANEALKASHEEAMAMNEELQTNNEELETSKEELQSLNEELTTLNGQLELKVEELERTTSDLSNLISSTQIATVFLDTQFHIRLFTPFATELFHLIGTDVGRPLGDIQPRFSDQRLLDDAAQVLKHLEPREQQVQGENGRSYTRRIVPYRSADDRIEGVVLTFVDVTGLEHLTARLRRRERQQTALAQLGQQAIIERDLTVLTKEAVEWVVDALDTDFAKVLELSPDGSSLRLMAGEGWETGEVGVTTIDAKANSQAGYTLISDSPVIVEDLATENRFTGPQLLLEHGVTSGISVVIRGNKGPFGVLGAHTRKRREFAAEDVHFMIAVANIISSTIERERILSALQESEARFRNLADNIAQLAWMTDREGSIFWYNRRWFEYTGTTLEEMKGWGWRSVHHPDHLARVEGKFRRHLELGTPWEDTFPLRGADGEYRWFLSRALPIFDDEDQVIGWFGTNTDITENRNAVQALRESEKRFRLLANAAPVLIWMSDPTQQTTWVNDAWLRFTGRPLEAELGAGWQEQLHAEDAESCRQRFARAFEKRQPFSMEFRLRRGDGSFRWLLFTGTPLFQNGEEFTGFIGSGVDITELKEAEKSLLAADRRKDEFIATLAHELRNPLTPITTGLALLRRTTNDPERSAELRSAMERQVRQLVRLVDDLLDVSRITRGRLELRQERLDLRVIAEDASRACQPHFENARQTLDLSLPPTPVEIEGDASRLTQVISNLLHNASKFSPPESTIHLSVGIDADHAKVIVRDHGVGIPAEMQQRIFEMFAQLGSAVKAGSDGLGIGLTLVKSLVDLHGGEILLRSEGADRGSEFEINLPLSNADEFIPETSSPPSPEEPQEEAETPRSLKKVLVVDDDAMIAKMIGILIEPLVGEIREAYNGLEAVEAAREFAPDIIFMDIGMPKLDGYGAAKRIRQEPWGKPIYMIALTGWGQEQDRALTREAGFDHHFTKPPDEDAVYALIRQLNEGKTPPNEPDKS